MKQDKLLSILLGCLLALSPLNIEAQQKLTGYPPVDKPPPANKDFTALVDLTKAPKAPVRKAPSQPCDAADDPFCYWSCTLCLRADDIKTCPNAKDWGITYDDGPSPFTPAVLDHHKAKGTKATFFVVGSRVSEYPDILKRVADEGHQIGIHTWSHTALTTQTNEVVIAELQWTAKAIQEATGKKPVVMRPPQGDHDDRIRYIAKSLGYKVVIWDEDPNDWMVSDDPKYDVSWITGNFSKWVKEPSTTGHISLEHDMFQKSAAEAPAAIDIVLGAGFTIKTVADCVGQPAFAGDATTSNTTDATPTSPAASPAATPAAKASAASKKAPSTTPAYPANVNNQYNASPSPSSSSAPSSSAPSSSPSPSASASSANLLTVNSFIGLSITAVITIVSYSLNF